MHFLSVYMSVNVEQRVCELSGYQVAQHLSNTYGDRAVKVARLAQLTGKRWPVAGRRLHDDYPYIEAEVCCFHWRIEIKLTNF